MAAQRVRVLIVDDNKNILAQVGEFLSKYTHSMCDGCDVLVEDRFDKYAERLQRERIDLVVLDVQKDEAPVDVVAGIAAHEKAKTLRVVPTVFYTAHSEKVQELRSLAVAVVAKDDSLPGLKKEIDSILDSGLIAVRQYLDESFGRLVTDAARGRALAPGGAKATIGANLARALSLQLETSAFREMLGLDPDLAHPNEVYSHAPSTEYPAAGDVYVFGGSGAFVVVVNPTCDLVCGVVGGSRREARVDSMLVAKCNRLDSGEDVAKLKEAMVKLAESDEAFQSAKSAAETTAKEEASTREQKAKANKDADDKRAAQKRDREKVESLQRKIEWIMANREPASHFLPGDGGEVPDLVADFHQLSQVPLSELPGGQLRRLVSMNSPFRELLNSRFAQFIGRIGVPKLDLAPVRTRLGLPSQE